jgi:hypothetical protein
MLLLVEVVVLNIGLDAPLFQHLVVLLAAVVDIGGQALGDGLQLPLEALYVFAKGDLTDCTGVDGVVQNLLVLLSHLYVVAGLELTFAHVVILHPPERRVGNGLIVAIDVLQSDVATQDQ